MNYSPYTSFTPLKNPYILKDAAPYGSQTPEIWIPHPSLTHAASDRPLTLRSSGRALTQRSLTSQFPPPLVQLQAGRIHAMFTMLYSYGTPLRNLQIKKLRRAICSGGAKKPTNQGLVGQRPDDLSTCADDTQNEYNLTFRRLIFKKSRAARA